MALLRRVLAVRPYGARVRNRVEALLERAGLVMDDAVIPEGTTDDEAVRAVLASRHAILVVPFHGHRDTRSASIDGLAFVRALEQAAGSRRFRVLMPVSSFGAASVALAEEAGTLPASVLVLPEDALEHPETVARVKAHVG